MRAAIITAICVGFTSCAQTACFAQDTQPQPKKDEQKPKLMLQGGIERLVGSTTLPEIILYKQTPRLAKVAPLTAGAGAAALKGGTEAINYPDYLVGKWGGTLNVVWAAHSFKEAPAQLRINNPGLVVFNFEKIGQTVYLHPTIIFFPRETHWAKDSAWMQNSPIRADDFEGLQRRAREGGMITGIPALELGGGRAQFMSGEAASARVVLNSLKTLRRGTVEHDLVIANWKGKSFSYYEEIISRFTWYSKDRVYVQIGSAQYDKMRKAISREILSGWIDSDWWPTANEIALMHGKSWEQVLKDDGIKW